MQKLIESLKKDKKILNQKLNEMKSKKFYFFRMIFSPKFANEVVALASAIAYNGELLKRLGFKA